MRFLCTTATVAGHLRVSDAPDLTDCNDLPFRKNLLLSNLYPDGCGIQRIQFHSPSAVPKSMLQPTHSHSPDKTVHTRITVVPLPHLQPTPPHPVCFCNIAYTHLISAYAINSSFGTEFAVSTQHTQFAV